jgi:hypothetical protein
MAALRGTGYGQSGVLFDARLAALGLRSLADLLAPPSLVIAEDYLALDGQYVRVLAVADLPPFVAAGWLSGVLAEKLAVDVSLHVRPLDAGRPPAASSSRAGALAVL